MSMDRKRRLMTGNTSMSTSKRSRYNVEDGVGGEDRISKLPETLIHHILSFLPTKCAVSTTVLSKGWKNLWISVPVLDFREWNTPRTQETLSSTTSFMDFMDRVLVLRNMLDLKKFYLTCNGKYFDDQRIKAWITTAIKCRVEELVVRRSGYEESDIFPVDLYTSESLTLLDIDFCICSELHLPQSISFPRLKILRLSEISFSSEPFTQQLFSNCPVLEELCFKNCDWSDLTIISSTLKSLTFVNSLRKCLSDVKVKIDAPNLMSITIDDSLPQHLVVDSFPSLVDADIDCTFSKPDNEVDIIAKIVKKLSNIKHLKLSGTILESLELANALSTTFPTFINLTTLEVSYIKTQQVGSIFTFLQFSPNLESLVLREVHDSDEVYEDALRLDAVPQCLWMHLKSIEFQDFEGELMELDLVRLFLQNAGVLQTVIIEIPTHSYSYVNSGKKLTAGEVEYFSKKIMEQLLKYKRYTTDCVIKLSSSPFCCIHLGSNTKLSIEEM